MGGQEVDAIRVFSGERLRGHRGVDERRERACVDLLSFVDVDRPPRVAFQAGIEEARGIWEAGPAGEHERFVSVCLTDTGGPLSPE